MCGYLLAEQEHIMISTRHLTTVAFVLAAISGLSAGDWYGFRGLEKEGCCDSDAGPLNWSSSQNVVWKTAIPGRGHSSPIVCEDAVYLTTTYEAAFISQTIWNYAVLALALSFTMTGISLAVRNIHTGKSKLEKLTQHARIFLFTQILTSVILMVLFGRHLLSLDDDTTRSWLISILVVSSCLMLSSLFVPLRSCQQLAASLLSFAFGVVVLIALKHQELVFSVSSLKGLMTAVVLISPLVLGFALLTAHFVSRKRQPTVVKRQDDARANRPTMWHFILTGNIGLFAGMAPFFLYLYRLSGYQMPDSFIRQNHVRPDVGWWCIGLYAILVLATIAGCYLRSDRHGLTKRYPLQKVFLLLGLTLGIAFIIQLSIVEKQGEFIRAVICLNRDRGEILWTCEGLVGQTGGRGRTVTHAAATPVTDGQHIYGYSGEDGLVCVSPEGKLLWKKTESMFVSKYGVATSPIVKDNVLIIVSDVRESSGFGSCIIAFDCISGKVLWRKERKSHQEHATYSTPLFKALNGKQAVIVHGWYDIRAYQLKTGQELWSYPMAHEGDHLVASVVSDGDHLYVMGAKQIRAFNLLKLGTESDPLLWSKRILGEKSSTPVVANGLLFLVTEAGVAFCLDAQTGEVLWKERLKGRYYSSVVTMGKQVLFTSESGQTTIVAVSREFRQLAKNTLDESVYASFAPVANQLFIRTNRHLYCIQEDEQ